jgi:hypothetical protein
MYRSVINLLASGLAVNPLPPIPDTGVQLHSLEFLPVSPPAPSTSADQSGAPPPMKSINENSVFYLASSYLDFGDCGCLELL